MRNRLLHYACTDRDLATGACYGKRKKTPHKVVMTEDKRKMGFEIF